MKRAGMSGFTLVETMIALILVSAVLIPGTFWIYRSTASRSAWEKFQAVQNLESEMNRAFLLRLDQDVSRELRGAAGMRVEIKAVSVEDGIVLRGTARNRAGKALTTMEMMLFNRDAKQGSAL